jgi:cytochrome c oxidase subunit 2
LDVRHSAGKIFASLLTVIALATVALFVARRWMPLAASQHAASLDRQFKLSLADSAIIFLIAQFALAVFVWRSRTPLDHRAETHARAIPIAVWIGVVFIGIELFSAATLGRSAWAAMYDVPSNASTVRVQAMGQQFAFYFRYPGVDRKFGPVHVDRIDASIGNYFGLDRVRDLASKDDITSAALVLPVNRPVELQLLSQDVIHGFYIRELRIQQDMVPGMEIPVYFTPTRIGTYEIVCSQLCGLGHYRMRAYLQVVSDSDFEKWMQAHAH